MTTTSATKADLVREIRRMKDASLVFEYERVSPLPDSEYKRLIIAELEGRVEVDGPIQSSSWSYHWSRFDGLVKRKPIGPTDIYGRFINPGRVRVRAEARAIHHYGRKGERKLCDRDD